MFGSRVMQSPEAVTDQIAICQILAALPPRQRESLEALAACGSCWAAASAMGITYGGFLAVLSAGRRRFWELWHEGETPPAAVWPRRARRTPETRASDEDCGTRHGYMRHRKRRENACRPCKDAWAVYCRERSAARERKLSRASAARPAA